MAKLRARNQSWPVEAPPEVIVQYELDEIAEEQQRQLEELENESAQNADGSLNHSAILRRWNRAR